MKICSCFGHRKIEYSEILEKKLYKLYENLIVNKNFSVFLFGGYGEFDELCQMVVKNLKNKYNFIKLIYVRPYYKELNDNVLNLYKKDFDDCVYFNLKNNFGKLNILYRNYEIVNRSDFVIFYVIKNYGGARNVLKYAEKLNKNFINLANINDY